MTASVVRDMGSQRTNPAAPSVVANLAGVGWFQVDTDRTITAVSPELERITGFTASEVLGKPCISLIRCRECLRDCGVFRHGRVDDAKLSVFRKDGTEIDVVRSGEVTHDASGHVTGAVESVRLLDVGAPARSFEQVETLLGSLGRMFIVADAGHRVMSASASLAESLGVAPEDLIVLPLTRIFGEALFGNGGTLSQALEAGVRREGWAAELTARNGRRIPVSISIGPIDAASHCGESGARHAIMIRPSDGPAAEKVMPFILTNGNNANVNTLVNGDPTNANFTYPFPLHWKDSWSGKAGVEFRATDATTLRAGYLYGTNPVPENSVFIAFPAISSQALTAGVGFKLLGLPVEASLVQALNAKQTGAASSHLLGTEYQNSIYDNAPDRFHAWCGVEVLDSHRIDALPCVDE